MQILSSRRVESEALHAFKGFCLSNDWVFVEIPQQADYGKDGYVDISETSVHHGRNTSLLTGEMFAVQVKGGASYRTSNGYRIPVGNHFKIWRESNVPVIGVVHDPDDQRLRWVNLTTYLSSLDEVSQVPVDADACLDDLHQLQLLLDSVRETSTGSSTLRGFGSLDESEQIRSVWDCFAFGRRDAKYFIALRRIFLSFADTAIQQATAALSFCTPHPDVFWHEDNWVVPEVKKQVQEQFQWQTFEAERLLTQIEFDPGIGRGTLGQCVFHLLVEDQDIDSKLESIVLRYPASGDEAAWSALLILLYLSTENEARSKLQSLMSTNPCLWEIPNFDVLVDHVNEWGWIDLF